MKDNRPMQTWIATLRDPLGEIYNRIESQGFPSLHQIYGQKHEYECEILKVEKVEDDDADDTDLLNRWNDLSTTSKETYNKRLDAQPLDLGRRPVWKRIPWIPRVFVQHWQIGRQYHTRWNAFRFAFSWTKLFIFSRRRAKGQ